VLKLRIPLVLGSRSPRRMELLQSVGLTVAIGAADVDESARVGESPAAYVERIARAKLHAACRILSPEIPRPLAVLVADTTVTIDGDVLGKPDDAAHAKAMLSRLSGRTHEVLTCYGIAIVVASDVTDDATGRQEVVRTVASRVSMRSSTPSEIERYVASGEPFDKAGAYAIQGLGAALVERIEGSYSGIVGLPLCEVVLDLQRLGVVGSGA
jgi:septum formation protein